MKRLLCVFAHPDDESFGPGGSLALWAKQGIEIFVLCVTKGDAGGEKGMNPEEVGKLRAKEIEEAAAVLGVKHVSFLSGYHDGQIGNNDLERLEKDILAAIKKYDPDTLLTFDLNGVSGHLDHIAVASATTQAFRKSKIAKQLYYFTNHKEISRHFDDYFIYFPEGEDESSVDLVIDYSTVWDTKVAAMKKHHSQAKDIAMILRLIEGKPCKDLFKIRTLDKQKTL